MSKREHASDDELTGSSPYSSHQVRNQIGRRVGPWTWSPGLGSQGSSLASASPFKLASNSLSATRDSSRASDAPRQKWTPCPNARCGFGSRAMSKRSAPWNWSGSRFAEPIIASTSFPAGTVWPSSSTARVGTRYIHWSGAR